MNSRTDGPVMVGVDEAKNEEESLGGLTTCLPVL